jgi:hypothetical protein
MLLLENTYNYLVFLDLITAKSSITEPKPSVFTIFFSIDKNDKCISLFWPTID